MGQFPPVVNCNANGGTPACPTGKKAFPTAAAAESFASDLQRRNPTAALQSPYACEECPDWHLSAMATDACATAKSRSSLPEKYASVRGLGLKYAHLQTAIKEAYLADVKDNGQYGSIRRTARKFGGRIPTGTHVPDRSGSPQAESHSVGSWSARVAKLPEGKRRANGRIAVFRRRESQGTVGSDSSQEAGVDRNQGSKGQRYG